MESLSPNIYVQDVKGTMQFYSKLGFKTVMSVPENSEEPVWAMMQNGGVTIMFESFTSIEGRLPQINRNQGGSLLFYVKVKDVQALYDSLKDEVTVLHGLQKTFYGATEFTIKDCNGYVLTFAD
jgi:uncharacterized glyoxalase superfamily protein PhnB